MKSVSEVWTVSRISKEVVIRSSSMNSFVVTKGKIVITEDITMASSGELLSAVSALASD